MALSIQPTKNTKQDSSVKLLEIDNWIKLGISKIVVTYIGVKTILHLAVIGLCKELRIHQAHQQLLLSFIHPCFFDE